MATTAFFMPTEQSTESSQSLISNAPPSPCFGRGIPGIVSNETSAGLGNFSISYGHVHGYVAVAVCLFGVLSNSANIIVLTRKNMASSTNKLLLWLAVADLLTMLSYLPFATHFYIMEPLVKNRPIFSSPGFPWICFLLFHASFSIVCHTIAIWLTIALAIFRYIYICKPTQGAVYCSQQRARKVIVVVIVLTILICIPNYSVNTYDIFNDPKNLTLYNTTAQGSSNSVVPYTIQVSIPYYHPTLRAGRTLNQVNYWIQAILIKMVPCFMLSALTILLVHAMHKAYRKRLKLKSQGRKAESDKHGEHNRVTGMLLAVVVLFTLTELPQGILTLMNIFIGCFTEVVYNRLGDLLDIMALTNNSVNFVLYCTMSTQFRNTFKEIFCCSSKNKPKWLKLRLVKSSNGRNTIEEPDKGKNKTKSKRNNELCKTNGNSTAKNFDNKPLVTTNNDKIINNDEKIIPGAGEFQNNCDHDVQPSAINNDTINNHDSGGQDQTLTYSPDQTLV